MASIDTWQMLNSWRKDLEKSDTQLDIQFIHLGGHELTGKIPVIPFKIELVQTQKLRVTFRLKMPILG